MPCQRSYHLAVPLQPNAVRLWRPEISAPSTDVHTMTVSCDAITAACMAAAVCIGDCTLAGKLQAINRMLPMFLNTAVSALQPHHAS